MTLIRVEQLYPFAAEAVRDIIKRDIAKHSVDFTRHTASTGLKIAGCFADLGTATTAAVSVPKPSSIVMRPRWLTVE